MPLSKKEFPTGNSLSQTWLLYPSPPREINKESQNLLLEAHFLLHKLFLSKKERNESFRSNKDDDNDDDDNDENNDRDDDDTPNQKERCKNGPNLTVWKRFQTTRAANDPKPVT